LNRPELTAEKFVPSPVTRHPSLLYNSGDLCCWLPDGNIRFLGRRDQQVKIRGFRVEPAEVEAHLLNHRDIREAVVTVRADAKGDRYLCAYFVAGPGVEGVEELKDFLAMKLPDYMVPAYFIPVGQMPRTRSDKIDRKALPDPVLNKGKEHIAPGNEIEKKLAALWASVLEIPKESISIDSDFFQLGGHSLNAIQVTGVVYRGFGVKLTLADVFKTPTIRSMAAFLAGKQGTLFLDLEPVEEKEYYELSYNQKRLWLLDRVSAGTSAFNIAGRVELDHAVEERVIKEVLYRLVERHESLRTGFRVVGDEVVQYVKPVQAVHIPLECIDISAMDEAERKEQREHLFSFEKQTPFDLDSMPLFRTLLIELTGACFDFIFNMHHIVTDGWSLEVLKEEFLLIYETVRTGKGNFPEPLTFRYRDFSTWHNRRLADPLWTGKSKQFWKQQFMDGVPVLELPMDALADRSNISGAAFHCHVPLETVEQLKTVAKGHSTSLFTVMFSLFLMLMSGISGRQKIMCSLISLGRGFVSLYSIVGFFVNSLLFKTELDPAAGFNHFLSRVKEQLAEMFRYQDFPVELVFKELKIKHPDVPVSFNMLNPDQAGPGILQQEYIRDSQHIDSFQDVKFDLEVYAGEHEGGMLLNWVYRKSLFQPQKIEYIAQEYLKLMDYFKENQHKSYKDYKNSETRRVFVRKS
jgi:acyl carrier protein